MSAALPKPPRFVAPITPVLIACGLVTAAGCGSLENLLSVSSQVHAELARAIVITIVTALVARFIVRRAPASASTVSLFFRSMTGGALGGATAGAIGLFATGILDSMAGSAHAPPEISVLLLVVGLLLGAVVGVFAGIAVFPLITYARRLASRLSDDAFESGLFVSACVICVGGLVIGTLSALRAKGDALLGAAMLGLSVLFFIIVAVRDARRVRFLVRVVAGRAEGWRIVDRAENDPPLALFVDGVAADKVLAFSPEPEPKEGGPFRAGPKLLERVAVVDHDAVQARSKVKLRAALSAIGALLAIGAAPAVSFGFVWSTAHAWRGPQASPWRVSGIGESATTLPVKLAPGDSAACAQLSDATIRCWGNGGGQIAGLRFDAARDAVPHSTLGRVRVLSIGTSHACAVREDGDRRAVCWGSNYLGQLGDGTKTDRSEPKPVGPTGVVEIAHGSSFTIALTVHGVVWRWGSDPSSDDRLGDPSKATPVVVEGLSNIAHVDAGRDHACALDREGKVFCWGSSLYGEAGTIASSSSGSRIKPTRVTGLPERVERIVLGPKSGWARSEGGWWGWGDHHPWGPTSTTATGGQVFAVAAIPDTEQLEDVHIGWEFACGLFKDGVVKCWGEGEAGRLGDGNMNGGTRGPSVVLLPQRILEIRGGERGACARGEKDVWCWGWL